MDNQRLQTTSPCRRMLWRVYTDDDDEKISNSFKLSRLTITRYPYQKCHINWTFMNSCNGLIFMATLYKDKMAICNPFTREFVDIPSGFTTTTEDKFEYYRESGFGYNPSTNEYKIVVICYKDQYPLRGPGKVSLYTLGSGKWRDKGETSYVLGGWINNIAPSLHLNGTVYWVNQFTEEIVSFDLETEEFRIVPSPPLPPHMYYKQLGSLGGCLYVIRKRSYVHNYCDVLVRNKEDYAWSKKFRNEKLCFDCKPLAILKSGKILWYSVHGSKPYVVYYDPETESIEMDENLIPFESWTTGIIHYEKSFVSLKALGEMNSRIYDFEEYIT